MLSQMAPVRLVVRRGFITAYKISFIKCVLEYTFGYKRNITIIKLIKSSVIVINRIRRNIKEYFVHINGSAKERWTQELWV